MDIEDRLLLYNLYYDRRKGEHRYQRRPISRIVSMPELGKAAIAIILRRPNDARARPGSVLNNDTTYTQMFHEDFDRDLYVVCVLLDRAVRERLKETDLGADVRADIRYHVATAVACDLAGKATPKIDEIVKLMSVAQAGVPNALINEWRDEVLKIYEELGGTDKVAKGPEMVERLKVRISERCGA